MIETGILDADEHVELLEGEIVQVSPQEPPHARATSRLNRWFARALGEEYVVRPQLPLTLPDSEPEPDLAVVWTRDEDRSEGHPRTALLVIEVADSSARHDLVVKSRVYAKARNAHRWVNRAPAQAPIAPPRGPSSPNPGMRTADYTEVTDIQNVETSVQDIHLAPWDPG